MSSDQSGTATEVGIHPRISSTCGVRRRCCCAPGEGEREGVRVSVSVSVRVSVSVSERE